jgi:hypothetical protein
MGMSARVELTDDELILLDGACTDEVQSEVDKAKLRIAAVQRHTDMPAHVARLVADAVAEGVSHGRLLWQPKRINRCAYCGTDKGYVAYKSGPRKGQPNYDRRIKVPGIEMAQRFVTVEGHAAVGGCTDCADAAADAITAELANAPCELPPHLRPAGAPPKRRYDRKRCTKCGWEGHEGEMRRLRTVLGDGTYPGGCPSCDNESGLFRVGAFERLEGFDVVTA